MLAQSEQLPRGSGPIPDLFSRGLSVPGVVVSRFNESLFVQEVHFPWPRGCSILRHAEIALRLNLNNLRAPRFLSMNTFASLVPLDALLVGERGCVADLDGPPAAISRLQEMGLRPGQALTMVRPGPPHLVQLGEVRLCLRPETGVVVLVGLGQV